MLLVLLTMRQFPHKLILTHTQFSRIRKAFANVSSVIIKFSKTQQFKEGSKNWDHYWTITEDWFAFKRK